MGTINNIIDIIGSLKDNGFFENGISGDFIKVYQKHYKTTSGNDSLIRYMIFDRKDNNTVIHISLYDGHRNKSKIIINDFIHPEDIENTVESFYVFNKFINTI